MNLSKAWFTGASVNIAGTAVTVYVVKDFPQCPLWDNTFSDGLLPEGPPVYQTGMKLTGRLQNTGISDWLYLDTLSLFSPL